MRRVLEFWRNIPIWKKLYFVVGLMTFLIAAELFTLRFAMRQLSAARAFVGGESLWSKAQKNAVFKLQRFGQTHDPADFQEYLDNLKVPEGDNVARIELLKPNPDFEKVREGFLQGRIHPDDIEPIYSLLRNFHWVSYLDRAIKIWEKADGLLLELKFAGQQYRDAIINGDVIVSRALMSEINILNEQLTVVEEEFSEVLGEGSRWLEGMVLFLLVLAVVSIESIGLTVTFFTSRGISRGLNELGEVAQEIGRGDFSRRATIRSRDEIGRVGQSINLMGTMLQQSFGDLEARVAERTTELTKMAAENAKLYEKAQLAVDSRDEFLSIASHELKTPLTALYLQLQRLSRLSENPSTQPSSKDIFEMANTSTKLARKITDLLNELLDLTRIRVGKFELHREPCDLTEIARDVIGQLSGDAAKAGVAVTFLCNGKVVGSFDRLRVSQVISNLLSNAIKYGNGKPVEVKVEASGGESLIQVKDQGKGIPKDQHKIIFNRFERGPVDPGISGLGLGLYISSQIISAHGGTIRVDSAPNEGALFTVRFSEEDRAHCPQESA